MKVGRHECDGTADAAGLARGALTGFGYGWQTAAAQAVGVLGVGLVGLTILRAGEDQFGGLLVLAPPLMLIAWAPAWLVFGLAWTLVG